MKKSIYWIIPLLMMFGLGLYGCADSFRADMNEKPSDSEQRKGNSDSEWISYTMEFNASDMITPSLRALTEAQENDIKQGSVRVLVFNTAGTFEYEAPVTSVTPTNDKKNVGNVQLLLKNTETEAYKFVMLANLQSDAPDASTFTGKSYDEVIKQFTFTMPSDGKWKGSDLPMWGEVTAVVNHNEGANPKISQTINLIRAVARIDVGLNLTSSEEGAYQFNEKAKGLEGITMTSVKFFNMNDKGTVAPASDNLEENSTKVIAPTIPEGVTAFTEALNMKKSIQGDNLLQRSVYVPEAVNPEGKVTQGANGETLPEKDQDKYLKRPYMVVGLTGTDKSNPKKETFFRIDFLKNDGVAEASTKYEYLHLLRNYRYLVNITNVGGPGFESEDDAKKGPAANIMYNVVVWNESDMTNVQYDGQYMLGVSKDKFKFYREGGKITAKVRTSWPKGFTVKNLPDWITYTTEPSVTNADKPTDEKIVTFMVKETISKDRTHPVNLDDVENALKATYIEAGRMKWFLFFEQSKDLNVTIQIYKDKECTQLLEFIEINQFGNKYGETNKIIKKDGVPLSATEASANVTFYVKTEPQEIEPTLTSDAGNIFIVKQKAKLSSGIWEYNVTAPDITDKSIDNGRFKDPFDSFNSNYTFTITHTQTNKSAATSISFLQKEYNAIPFYDETLFDNMFENEDDHIYIMDGEEKEYYVKANAAYNIKLISEQTDQGDGNVINNFEESEDNIPYLSGKPIKFISVDDVSNPTRFFGKAKFQITSPTGHFPLREFTATFVSAIKQPEANTYMIKAGAKQGILIPVSRVNTARDYYESLLNKDTNYYSGAKEIKKLPGSKSDFMLNKLENNDDYSIDIIWTDIHKSPNSNPVKLAGLKELRRFDSEKSSYIYVQAGDEIGNVLIAIRSNRIQRHPILWSWHIWIVDDYPKVKELDTNKGQINKGIA